MAVSLALGGLADQPGGPFLNELNGAVRAITTFSASSSEPPVYDQCMAWFDLNVNHFKIRNPQNTGWVSVFRITSAGSVPLIQGIDTTPLASLASALAAAPAGSEGFLKRNANGAIVVATMESPDLPTFGANRSGMVPGVTPAQLDANAALRAQGWKLGPALVGERVFAGAQDYALALPQADRYQISVRVAMSNNQPLFLQVGNGGSPRQSGYQCAVSRSWVTVETANSLSSGQVQQSQPETTTAGFQLWRTHSGITQMLINGELVNMGGGLWCWQSSGGAITGGLDADVCRGDVTLTGGTLDYIRVISAGDPRGTFNSRASINTGKIRVFAA